MLYFCNPDHYIRWFHKLSGNKFNFQPENNIGKLGVILKHSIFCKFSLFRGSILLLHIFGALMERDEQNDLAQILISN